MRRSIVSVCFLLAACMLPASPALASSFPFNQGNCSSTCGTIAITQYATNVVDVLVTWNAGVGFVDTGSGDHPDLAWSLDNSLPALTGGGIQIVQSGKDGSNSGTPFVWAFGGAATTSDGLGTFDYQLNCSGAAPSGFQRCGNGGSNPDYGPFEFRITLAGITPSSFSLDGNNVLFAADVINGYRGATGLTWNGTAVTTESINPVPEPGSLLLLGTGLVLAARLIRRRP